MTWTDCRLGDVITLKRGHDLPKSRRQEGDVPVVSSSGITGSHNEAKVLSPGVVTGRYGTLGQVFYIDQDYWPLNTALYVTDFKGNHPHFVAYFLKTILCNYQSDKAAVPGVNRNVLHDISVSVPDRDCQFRIASILSTYDDLIENNRRRMALLEDAARQIYKEWFVRLRFPGREHSRIKDGVPEGWEKKTLGEHAPLNYGKALKSDDRIQGEYPVFGSSGIVGTHEKPLVSGPGIIVGRKGNVGSVYWSSKSYCPIDTVYFVASHDSNLYLYYALNQMHFISTDVAVPGLNRDFAHSRNLLIPKTSIVHAFLEIISPMHDQMDKLNEINQKLRSGRNLLLPKLMNGQIAV